MEWLQLVYKVTYLHKIFSTKVNELENGHSSVET